MNLRSFRLKLTLLAAGVTGAVIGALSLVGWGLVSHADGARLDREIRVAAVAFQDTGPPNSPTSGGELEQIRFAVRDVAQGVLFRSTGWPEGLEDGLAKLPLPASRCQRSHATWSWDPHDEPPAPNHIGAPEPPPAASGHGAPHGCLCARAAYTTVILDSGSWRVGAFPDGPLTLFVAVNLRRFDARTSHLAALLAVALTLSLLAAGIGGWWLSGRALRPLAPLTVAAEEITADQLDRRISADGADQEFARLIEVFNAMLQRLETSYKQALRFSADVSHELKTPLAIMQGEVETALGQTSDGGPEQRALAAQLESIARLSGLVNKLLILSRADAGTLRPRVSELDLSTVVADFCEDFGALHPELRFEAELAENVVISADPSLAPQIVQNLLANAVKYNRPDEGWVRVELATHGDQATVRVSNSGPEIEAEARGRLFDRFYRADTARSLATGGGLGLALAREFARAHGGDVVLEDSPSATTHVFRVTLPLA
ncbi:ATP-binding protein [Planctomycetota bacterium]|nr:ATP-binding protein [Planctomycetota bacterium]